MCFQFISLYLAKMSPLREKHDSSFAISYIALDKPVSLKSIGCWVVESPALTKRP